MDADRTNLTALTSGGAWDHSPAWSPSGDRIAYAGNHTIWLIDPDGANAVRTIAGVFWDGGLSWSPDGQRIAFARGDRSESSIMIARVDGLGEEVVLGTGGRNVGPRWSPDGDRIAFTRYETDDINGSRWVYTTGARGSATATGTDCRPRGLSGTTAGFPLSSGAVPSTGTLRVAPLFMDFSDAQASYTTQQEAELGLPHMEAYLESVSYGLVDVELVPHHVWLRAELPHSGYIDELANGPNISTSGSAHAVELADDDVDFSNIDLALVVFPSSHFGGGNAGGTALADGVEVALTRANTSKRDESGEPRSWGSTAAHEIVHNLGLLDMYPYDASLHDTPTASAGKEWIPFRIGLMGLGASFLDDASKMSRRVTKHYPDGSYEWLQVDRLRPAEMLAWSRWQLGWLGDDQVRCITQPADTVELGPIAQPSGAVAMAAVPLNVRELIVVESRRKLGYDLGLPHVWRNGSSTNLPALIEEGVLVYTVDALIGSGQLPLRVVGDSGNGQVDDFPLLTIGESVTVRGYTITVIADNDDTHTVTITKAG